MVQPGQAGERELLKSLVERGMNNEDIAFQTSMSERKVRSLRKEYGLRKRDLLSDLSGE